MRACLLGARARPFRTCTTEVTRGEDSREKPGLLAAIQPPGGRPAGDCRAVLMLLLIRAALLPRCYAAHN